MSLSYKPGDSVTASFVTSRFDTGAATTADSLPSGTVNHNGTDDGAVTVTVTNIDTGRYKATFTIPATYLAGDDVILSIAATVNSVAGKNVVWKTRVGNGVIRSAAAAAGAGGTITLDASATTTVDFYRGTWIALIAGTGAGQIRYCTAYSSGRVATIVPNWITNPDTTSIFMILPAAGVDVEMWLNTVVTAATAGVPDVNTKRWNNTAITGTVPPDVIFTRSGTAQAGGASTITLDSGAVATDSFYNGQLVLIRSGTGAGQVGAITGYVGSSKVATISGTWATNPDNTSVFSTVAFAAGSTSGVNVTQWGGVGVGALPATVGDLSTDYMRRDVPGDFPTPPPAGYGGGGSGGGWTD